jgi:hypothetical protein
MSYQIYNNVQDTNSDIVCCIIDTKDRYTDTWIKELIKNNADWELSSMTGKGFDVIAGTDEDQILQVASKKYHYAVVFSMGTVLAGNTSFLDLVKEKCQDDFFLMGHILDRKEGYYELHDQCYIINLKYYKDLDCPEIGKTEYFQKHIQVQPVRSDANFHDDYTPIEVSSGTESKTYIHKRHGWNILSLGFDKRLKMIPFSEGFRNSKRYFYPDDDKKIQSQSRFYLEMSVASKNWINPFGTSDSPLPQKFSDKLSSLVTPCNGLDWIKYLLHYGFKKNTRVRFVDYNNLFLEFTKRLTQWDGKDYIEFLDSFGLEKNLYLGLPSDMWYSSKDNNYKKWISFKQSIPNWDEVWKEIQDNVSFEFYYKDFLVLDFSENWIDDSFNDSCTLINLNHVFSYHSTSIFYPLKYRISLENNTIENLKNVVPQAYVYFEHRAWKGFKKYNQHSNFSQAKNLEILDFQELKLPSWHDKHWYEQ